jgi:hypothetical protein
VILSDEQLTRNWHELLQELRVTQTGVQILTGFLLTLPFTDRFDELNDRQLATYLTLLVLSVVTMGFIVAPVAHHRTLFRKRQRPWLVAAADLSAKVGLVLLAVTSAGIVLFAFDVVVSLWAGVIAALGALALLTVLWGAAPLMAASPTPAPDASTKE